MVVAVVMVVVVVVAVVVVVVVTVTVANKLKLNPDKTDLIIIIGTKHQRNRVMNYFSIKLLGSDTFQSDTVRNLVVVFDSDFNRRQYISQESKSCFYHTCDLRRIRRHISTAKTISTAFISSRLDYCNSLLNNIAKRDLAKLQRVQNSLARVVLRVPRFSPSIPLLKQLHWLPLSHRINFMLSSLNILLYLHNHHPTWLVSCICQIFLGSSDNQLHNNLLCLKQNLTWVSVLYLSLRLGSGMNSLSL